MFFLTLNLVNVKMAFVRQKYRGNIVNNQILSSFAGGPTVMADMDNSNIMLSQSEIDKLIQKMEQEKQEQGK